MLGLLSSSTFDLLSLLTFVVFGRALHIAPWAMSRYRLPVDAVLLIFAAVGLAAIGERLTRSGATAP